LHGFGKLAGIDGDFSSLDVVASAIFFGVYIRPYHKWYSVLIVGDGIYEASAVNVVRFSRPQPPPPIISVLVEMEVGPVGLTISQPPPLASELGQSIGEMMELSVAVDGEDSSSPDLRIIDVAFKVIH
jgi:hypothetical protein